MNPLFYPDKNKTQRSSLATKKWSQTAQSGETISTGIPDSWYYNENQAEDIWKSFETVDTNMTARSDNVSPFAKIDESAQKIRSLIDNYEMTDQDLIFGLLEILGGQEEMMDLDQQTIFLEARYSLQSLIENHEGNSEAQQQMLDSLRSWFQNIQVESKEDMSSLPKLTDVNINTNELAELIKACAKNSEISVETATNIHQSIIETLQKQIELYRKQINDKDSEIQRLRASIELFSKGRRKAQNKVQKTHEEQQQMINKAAKKIVVQDMKINELKSTISQMKEEQDSQAPVIEDEPQFEGIDPAILAERELEFDTKQRMLNETIAQLREENASLQAKAKQDKITITNLENKASGSEVQIKHLQSIMESDNKRNQQILDQLKKRNEELLLKVSQGSMSKEQEALMKVEFQKELHKQAEQLKNKYNAQIDSLERKRREQVQDLLNNMKSDDSQGLLNTIMKQNNEQMDAMREQYEKRFYDLKEADEQKLQIQKSSFEQRIRQLQKEFEQSKNNQEMEIRSHIEKIRADLENQKRKEVYDAQLESNNKILETRQQLMLKIDTLKAKARKLENERNSLRSLVAMSDQNDKISDIIQDNDEEEAVTEDPSELDPDFVKLKIEQELLKKDEEHNRDIDQLKKAMEQSQALELKKLRETLQNAFEQKLSEQKDELVNELTGVMDKMENGAPKELRDFVSKLGNKEYSDQQGKEVVDQQEATISFKEYKELYEKNSQLQDENDFLKSTLESMNKSPQAFNGDVIAAMRKTVASEAEQITRIFEENKILKEKLAEKEGKSSEDMTLHLRSIRQTKPLLCTQFLQYLNPKPLVSESDLLALSDPLFFEETREISETKPRLVLHQKSQSTEVILKEPHLNIKDLAGSEINFEVEEARKEMHLQLVSTEQADTQPMFDRDFRMSKSHAHIQLNISPINVDGVDEGRIDLQNTRVKNYESLPNIEKETTKRKRRVSFTLDSDSSSGIPQGVSIPTMPPMNTSKTTIKKEETKIPKQLSFDSTGSKILFEVEAQSIYKDSSVQTQPLLDMGNDSNSIKKSQSYEPINNLGTPSYMLSGRESHRYSVPRAPPEEEPENEENEENNENEGGEKPLLSLRMTKNHPMELSRLPNPIKQIHSLAEISKMNVKGEQGRNNPFSIKRAMKIKTQESVDIAPDTKDSKASVVYQEHQQCQLTLCEHPEVDVQRPSAKLMLGLAKSDRYDVPAAPEPLMKRFIQTIYHQSEPIRGEKKGLGDNKNLRVSMSHDVINQNTLIPIAEVPQSTNSSSIKLSLKPSLSAEFEVKEKQIDIHKIKDKSLFETEMNALRERQHTLYDMFSDIEANYKDLVARHTEVVKALKQANDMAFGAIKTVGTDHPETLIEKLQAQAAYLTNVIMERDSLTASLNEQQQIANKRTYETVEAKEDLAHSESKNEDLKEEVAKLQNALAVNKLQTPVSSAQRSKKQLRGSKKDVNSSKTSVDSDEDDKIIQFLKQQIQSLEERAQAAENQNKKLTADREQLEMELRQKESEEIVREVEKNVFDGILVGPFIIFDTNIEKDLPKRGFSLTPVISEFEEIPMKLSTNHLLKSGELGKVSISPIASIRQSANEKPTDAQKQSLQQILPTLHQYKQKYEQQQNQPEKPKQIEPKQPQNQNINTQQTNQQQLPILKTLEKPQPIEKIQPEQQLQQNQQNQQQPPITVPNVKPPQPTHGSLSIKKPLIPNNGASGLVVQNAMPGLHSSLKQTLPTLKTQGTPLRDAGRSHSFDVFSPIKKEDKTVVYVTRYVTRDKPQPSVEPVHQPTSNTSQNISSRSGAEYSQRSTQRPTSEMSTTGPATAVRGMIKTSKSPLTALKNRIAALEQIIQNKSHQVLSGKDKEHALNQALYRLSSDYDKMEREYDKMSVVIQQYKDKISDSLALIQRLTAENDELRQLLKEARKSSIAAELFSKRTTDQEFAKLEEYRRKRMMRNVVRANSSENDDFLSRQEAAAIRWQRRREIIQERERNRMYTVLKAMKLVDKTDGQSPQDHPISLISAVIPQPEPEKPKIDVPAKPEGTEGFVDPMPTTPDSAKISYETATKNSVKGKVPKKLKIGLVADPIKV